MDENATELLEVEALRRRCAELEQENSTLHRVNVELRRLPSSWSGTAPVPDRTAAADGDVVLSRFVQAAPCAIALFDREMRYIAASRRWRQDYGLTDDLIGRSHYEVFPEIEERWKAVHRRALSGSIETSEEDRFDRANGATQWLRWDVCPWHNSRGEIGGVIMLTEDITVRKRALDGLLERKQQLRTILEAELECVKLLDASGCVLDMNPAGLAMIEAKSLDEVLGRCVYPTVVENYREMFQALTEEVFRGQSGTLQYEITGLKGTRRWLETHASPLRTADGQITALVGVTRDITQRKQAETERQVLLVRLASAEERERQRLARDLHDHLSQYLTALRLAVEVLESRLQHPDEAREQIRQITTLTQRLDDEAHRLAWELWPTALDDTGLLSTLEQYVEEWASRTRVQMAFQPVGMKPDRLPRELERTIYRVAQEALTNVARHAAARQVSVILERTKNGVRLIVEDDGRGFDVEAAEINSRDRLGLRGMKERVHLAGGKLDVESTPGSGTTVFVHIRLPHQAAQGGAE